MIDFEAFCQAVERSPSVYVLHAYGLERDVALATAGAKGVVPCPPRQPAGASSASPRPGHRRRDTAGESDEIVTPTVAFGGYTLAVDDETLRREAAAQTGRAAHRPGASAGVTRPSQGTTNSTAIASSASLTMTNDALAWSTDSPIGDQEGGTAALGTNSSNASSFASRSSLHLAASGRARGASIKLDKLIIDELDDESSDAPTPGPSSTPSSQRQRRNSDGGGNMLRPPSASTISLGVASQATPNSTGLERSPGAAALMTGASDDEAADRGAAVFVLSSDSVGSASATSDAYVIQQGGRSRPAHASGGAKRLRAGDNSLQTSASGSGSGSTMDLGAATPRAGAGRSPAGATADGTALKPVVSASAFTFSASDAGFMMSQVGSAGASSSIKGGSVRQEEASQSLSFRKPSDGLLYAALEHIGLSRAGMVSGLALVAQPPRLILCSQADGDIAIVDRSALHAAGSAATTSRRNIAKAKHSRTSVHWRGGPQQQPIVQLLYADSSPRSCATSGKWLAVALSSTAVNRYDLSSGRPMPSLLHGSTVNAVAYHSNGRMLAAATEDGPCVLWSLRGANATPSLVFNDHDAAALCISFDPQGRDLVASGSNDGTARLWRAQSGKSMAVVKHLNAVSDVVFDATGTLLVSVSALSLHVTNVESGTQVCSIACLEPQITLKDSLDPANAFTAAAFLPTTDPARRLLVAATSDGLVHIIGLRGPFSSSSEKTPTSPPQQPPHQSSDDCIEGELSVLEAHRAVTRFSAAEERDDEADEERSAKYGRTAFSIFCGDVAGNVYCLDACVGFTTSSR